MRKYNALFGFLKTLLFRKCPTLNKKKKLYYMVTYTAFKI